VTNQNLIQEEFKRRLNSGNASCLLLKNLRIRIYKTVILTVVLYGCETWSPTLKGGEGWSDGKLEKTA
jgi:hypothetical protein